MAFFGEMISSIYFVHNLTFSKKKSDKKVWECWMEMYTWFLQESSWGLIGKICLRATNFSRYFFIKLWSRIINLQSFEKPKMFSPLVIFTRALWGKLIYSILNRLSRSANVLSSPGTCLSDTLVLWCMHSAAIAMPRRSVGISAPRSEFIYDIVVVLSV